MVFFRLSFPQRKRLFWSFNQLVVIEHENILKFSENFGFCSFGHLTFFDWRVADESLCRKHKSGVSFTKKLTTKIGLKSWTNQYSYDQS